MFESHIYGNWSIRNYRCFSNTPVDFDLKPGITAIVGENNAGKTTLLRFFSDIRRECARYGNSNDTIRSAALESLPAKFSATTIDPSEVFSEGVDEDMVCIISPIIPESVTDIPNDQSKLTFTYSRTKRVISSTLAAAGIRTLPTNQFWVHGQYSLRENNLRQHIDVRPLLQSLTDVANSIHITSGRSAARRGTSGEGQRFDVPNGTDLVSLWRQAKVGDNRDLSKIAMTLEKDIARLLSLKSFSIDSGVNNDIFKIQIEGAPRRLDEVGGGIEQILSSIIGAGLRKPSFIFIDEPETGLHPSLQRDFVETLAKYATRGLVMTTHSLALARSTADTTLCVRRKEEGARSYSIIEPFTESANQSSMLAALSFGLAAPVKGLHILLVEGISDVRSIDAWLKQLGIAHMVASVPLGGVDRPAGDSRDWVIQLTKLCPHVWVWLDSDREREGGPPAKNREARVTAWREAGAKCEISQRRSLENYATQRALVAAGFSDATSLQPFERLDGAKHRWQKADMQAVARNMSLDEIRSTDLGAFLEQLKASVEEARISG